VQAAFFLSLDDEPQMYDEVGPVGWLSFQLLVVLLMLVRISDESVALTLILLFLQWLYVLFMVPH